MKQGQSAFPGSGVVPGIGVAIVTYRASAFIADCLESLLASRYPHLKIVVVDNASPDDTPDAVRRWAAAPAPRLRDDWPFAPGHAAPRPIMLAETGPQGPAAGPWNSVTLIGGTANLGYAGGVNQALRALQADPEISLFWVLNPDTLIEPQTPFALAARAAAAGRFAVIGGRVVFHEAPDTIQIDGGRLHRLTASVSSVHIGRKAQETAPPAAETLDFITGASLVASRDFLDRAGLMDEGYFLYFEEIDWQLRRGDLPLAVAAEAIVRHRAGVTIGSGGAGKPAPLSVYFTYRNLLRFVARHFHLRLPFAYAFAWIRMLRNLDGTWAQFAAFLAGLHQLPPPAAVRRALHAGDWARILAGARGQP